MAPEIYANSHHETTLPLKRTGSLRLRRWERLLLAAEAPVGIPGRPGAGGGAAWFLEADAFPAGGACCCPPLRLLRRDVVEALFPMITENQK